MDHDANRCCDTGFFDDLEYVAMKFARGQPVVCIVDPETFRAFLVNQFGQDREIVNKIPLPELDGIYHVSSYSAPFEGGYPAMRLQEFGDWIFEESCFRALIKVEDFVT